MFTEFFNWLKMTARLKRRDAEAREKNPQMKNSEFTAALHSEFGGCEDFDAFLEKYICYVSTTLLEQSVKNNSAFLPEPIITLTELRLFMDRHKFGFKK